MNKAIVFDFDGVIINSTEVQRLAFTESYNQIVKVGNPSFDEFLSHSGDSLQNIFLKMKLPLEMIEPYRRISRENTDLICIYDGMFQILSELNNNGFCCGLCTGKDRERTIDILNKFDLINYFDAIVCSDDVKYPKPHHESLKLAMKIIDSNETNTIMIGDAVNDILCAKNSGVRCIAVTWGDIKEEVIVEANPDLIIRNIDELLSAIVNLLEE